VTTVDIRPVAWCPQGVGAFQTSFSDPGGSAAHLVGWALEYVYPLNAWLDQLVGDEAAVASLSAEWVGASRELRRAEEGCSDTLRAIADLQGRSVRALRLAVEEIRAAAHRAGYWTEAASASLDLASRIVTALHDAVVGALSELAGLIASLFDFQLSLSSLNPLDKMQKLRNLTRAVDRFVRVIEGLLDDMFDAFESLVRLIRTLEPLLQEGLDGLRELASRMVDGVGIPLGILIGGTGGLLAGGLPGLVVGAAAGGVLGDSLAGAASDWLASDPRVSEIDISDVAADGVQNVAFGKAMDCNELSSLESFVEQNGLTDDMGKSDRTCVDVKRVIASDGTEHWVVSLPSTLDWNVLKSTIGEDSWADLLKDYPATNDLDTNIALMLFDHPEFATQYQRGIYEAMRQAGVEPGADVVFTGFSQGGIMSASLAADRSSPYHVAGIVTTGAPTGHFDIPSDVTVIAFANADDPVIAVTALVPGAGGPPPIPLSKPNEYNDMITAVPEPHSSPGYQETVREWEAANSDTAAAFIDLVGGTVVDHQVYAFTE